MGTRGKTPFLALAAVAALMLSASAALADGVQGDSDNDALATPTVNTLTRQQQVGTTVEYPFSILVKDAAPRTDNVCAGPNDIRAVAISATAPSLPPPEGSPSNTISPPNCLETS